jgi:hypothetical protein
MSTEAWELDEATEEVSRKLAALGPPLGEFSVHENRFVLQLLAAPALLLVGLALVVLPAVALLWAAKAGALLFKLVITGCVLIASGVLLAVRAYRNRGLRVLVYAEGVLRLRRGEAKAFFWDEVAGVWKKKNQAGLHKVSSGNVVYVVQCAGGKEYHFDDAVPDLKRLGELIQERTLPHLLPRALADYHAGKLVDFHKLRVSKAGVHNGDDLAAWDQVQSIKLTDAALTVEKKGNWLTWLTVAAGEVRNPHVFTALVERARGITVQREA